MVWIYIGAALLMIFFLLRNIVSQQMYLRYAKEAVLVFDDSRKSHKVFRIVSLCLFILMVIALVYTVIVSKVTFTVLMGEICLISVFALYAFVPYTHGKWVVTEEGVYLYNYNLFIRWSEMVSARPEASGKKSFLILHLLGDEGNKLKKLDYPLMLEGPRVQEMQAMFREFIALEDKRRHRLKVEAQRAERDAEIQRRKENRE